MVKRSLDLSHLIDGYFNVYGLFIEGDLHYAMEIDRNIDAVPDEWDVDADETRLRKDHGTLKPAKRQIGICCC